MRQGRQLEEIVFVIILLLSYLSFLGLIIHLLWTDSFIKRTVKNAASNTEQVLKAAAQKAAAVWPPTTHHENYPS